MKSLSDILGGGVEAAPKGKMSEEEIKAKLEVVQELMNEMLTSMGNGVKSHLDGMQQVSVAAPNADLLAEGLDKAKEIVPQIDDAEESLESPDEKSAELKDPSVELEEEPTDLYSMMQKKKKSKGL